MSNVTDFEKETDIEIWWRITKELYGKDVKSRIIGTGVYQVGYEYIKEIIAYKGDDEVSKFVFEKIPEGLEEYDKAA